MSKSNDEAVDNGCTVSFDSRARFPPGKCRLLASEAARGERDHDNDVQRKLLT